MSEDKPEKRLWVLGEDGEPRRASHEEWENFPDEDRVLKGTEFSGGVHVVTGFHGVEHEPSDDPKLWGTAVFALGLVVAERFARTREEAIGDHEQAVSLAEAVWESVQ